jgi:cytochrome d ubiquinol oxidase subunit II
VPAAETTLGAVILTALTLYALGGGADFGAGVWDLLARGSAADRQRDVIARAMGPVWEANHVWLILVIVLLFVCFPVAFAAIAIALHIPLAAMLVGIVLRGSAFVFRTYDSPTGSVQRRWGRVFAIASIVTPLTFGMCVGAVASGRILVEPESGRVLTDFVSSWWAPFPVALGFFTLALFAFLAAVFLTLETADRALQRAFRRRALAAGVAVGALAFLCLGLAKSGAPVVFDGLAVRGLALPFQIVTGVVSVGALAALWWGRHRLARALAILQVTLIVWGWGLSQYPYLVVPDVTIDLAAPQAVLRLVLAALGAGAVILLPALAYLFAVFKSRPAVGYEPGDSRR